MDGRSNFGGFGDIGGGLGQFFSGLFGDSSSPYKDYAKQYQKFLGQAQGAQNPFLNMGQGAIAPYQQWLQGQQDPSGFINNLMGQYQESPWAKFEQQQATRAAQNQGSAAGLTGSTPLMQFAQQNAQNISSQDMQNWLGNVLGINTQYGSGLQNEISGGQNAANQLTNLFNNAGQNLGEAAYGQRAGQNADRSNLWGGLINSGLGLAGLFL